MCTITKEQNDNIELIAYANKLGINAYTEDKKEIAKLWLTMKTMK